ncbi:MAG: PAS domain-containing protein, partial [Halobaculum sp.]
MTDEKELQQRLRRENELRERVFETTPTGVAVLDGDGTFLRANDRTRELLGFDESDLGTVRYDEFDWEVSEDDEASVPVERVFELDDSAVEEEYVLTAPDGTRRYLSVSAAPLDGPTAEDDPADTSERVVVVLDDHTEQHLLERRLRESETSLRRLYEVAGDAE